MDIKFRKASTDDIKALIEVQNKSFYEDFKKYGECPAYNESEEKMEHYISHYFVYVMEFDDKVVGDVIIIAKESRKYYLRVIAVDPSYHNKGFGQKAIQYIETQHLEPRCWELITPFESYRNHYFYEKMGYIKINEYKHSDILTMFEYRKVMEERGL